MAVEDDPAGSKLDVTEFDIHARNLEDVIGKFGKLLQRQHVAWLVRGCDAALQGACGLRQHRVIGEGCWSQA